MRMPISKCIAALVILSAVFAWPYGAFAQAPGGALPDFTGVVDRTRGIGDDERDAYFQLLDFAARGDFQQQMSRAGQNYATFEKRFYERQNREIEENPQQPRYRFSLYADLLKNPQDYRGELLPLRGHIRRLEEMPLMDGDDDLGVAYQTYLFTEDSRTHPYIIISREVPPDLPRGGDILEEVEVAGYFFKIYAYDAQDAVRIAPLLIAQRLEWFPRQPGTPLASPLWVGVAAVAALLILVALLWRIAANDRRVRRNRLRQIADEAAPFSPPES